jgi:hypothetical protein
MVETDTYASSDRLAWLVRRLTQFASQQSCDEAQGRDAPYLITGPQAAYEYHRWLTPLENLVTLQVYAEEISTWQGMAGKECRVFETAPTTVQVNAAPEAIILDATLEPGRYRRRRVIGKLVFVAPEDLCLDLLARARGETSLAEAAAIIVAQREALVWEVLLEQAERRGLARRLGALLDAINTEMEMNLASLEAIKELGQWVERMTPPLEQGVYPPGRHRSVPPSYQPIVERWGVHLTLPRYVIGKVVMDLESPRS